jgi:hypothetical protein
MTKFEELIDIITGKKNKNSESNVGKKEELEVSGCESRRTPLL